MNRLCYLFVSLLYSASALVAQTDANARTIHVFVALCDNENQGIVPVPESLGDGQEPRTNLYWGALYGVKTHLKRSDGWVFVKTLDSGNSKILERVLFKHKDTDTYLLADAYDGKYIKATTETFLKAASGEEELIITFEEWELRFGGGANLLAYVGHDGLMEFQLDMDLQPADGQQRDAIVLACISKRFFKPYLERTGANPLVWTTGLMAPEAYTLKAAMDGWILKETDEQIRERAAQAYHQYQKCGVRAARNLLVTGF